MLSTVRRLAATAAAVALLLIGGAGVAHADPLKMSDAGYRAAAAALNNANNATTNRDRTFWLGMRKLALNQADADRRAGN